MFPFLLYSETHFRFSRWFPSLIYKKEPEIIFDCPSRIAPGISEIPLYLFIKDHQMFPIDLMRVDVNLSDAKQKRHSFSFDDLDRYRIPHSLEDTLLAFRLPLSLLDAPTGRMGLFPKLTYMKKKKKKIVLVDNLPGTSKMPLLVYYADAPYPGSEQTRYYDFHTHSLHTHDHVEFGAPVPCISECTHVMGLSGAAIVDHSYDISCCPEDYLKQDDLLQHWQMLKAEEKEDHGGRDIFCGEEISCKRKDGGVVHLGAFGHEHFIPGSGDGARWGYAQRENNEPTLPEAADLVANDGGICFAAHPGEKPNIFHRIFLRRDHWRAEDFTADITAFQALNRGFDSTWYSARELWVSLLLQGKRLPLLAGNDTHGDFNRYRAIAIPFIALTEEPTRFFGFARTGIYGDGDVKESIRNGKTMITTGPFADIQCNGLSCISTQNIPRQGLTVLVESNKEFGEIQKVRLHCGKIGEKEEVAYQLPLKEHSYIYQYDIPETQLLSYHYCRLEAMCSAKIAVATSPVWFV